MALYSFFLCFPPFCRSTSQHTPTQLVGKKQGWEKSFESSTIFHNFCYVCVFVIVTSMLSFNSVHHYSTQTFPCILVLLKLTFFAQFILWPMPPCINATISIIRYFQYNFPNEGGGQRPFGIFPKIHPIW